MNKALKRILAVFLLLGVTSTIGSLVAGHLSTGSWAMAWVSGGALFIANLIERY